MGIFEAHMNFLKGRFGWIWFGINIFQFCLAIILQSIYKVYSGPAELVTWAHIANVMSQGCNAALYTYVHYRYHNSLFFKNTGRFLSKLLYMLYLYLVCGLLMVAQIITARVNGSIPLTQFFISTTLFHTIQAYLIFILLENFFPFTSPLSIGKSNNDGVSKSKSEYSRALGSKVLESRDGTYTKHQPNINDETCTTTTNLRNEMDNNLQGADDGTNST